MPSPTPEPLREVADKIAVQVANEIGVTVEQRENIHGTVQDAALSALRRLMAGAEVRVAVIDTRHTGPVRYTFKFFGGPGAKRAAKQHAEAWNDHVPGNLRPYSTDLVLVLRLAAGEEKDDAEPHCPVCGYTKEDQRLHGDHHLCGGTIPDAD